MDLQAGFLMDLQAGSAFQPSGIYIYIYIKNL